MIASSSFVPVEEYLNHSYPNGDCEYLDGVLLERNVGSIPHGLLQKILLLHFAVLESEFGIEAIPECRTRITAARFRVPDILVVRKPFDRRARLYSDVPRVVIEILSPDDSVKATLARFADYQNLGVPFILLMDPEALTTHVFENGNLLRRELTTLSLPEAGQIPFDTSRLLDQLGRA